jgi:choline dehydrogenase-like flavoprotein
MQKIDKYDVCVVGAGAAGIIFTLEYAKLNPSKKIVLVEFGSQNIKDKNKLDDSIQINNPLNHHSPYECTNKGLGGSTATWGGRCVMYDEIDFEPRNILNGGCTWDKSLFEELKLFAEKSSVYFESGKATFDINKITETRLSRIATNFIEGDVTDSVLERWSMPTRFGSRYKEELNGNQNVTVLEGFELRDLLKDDKKNNIKSVVFFNSETKENLTILAEEYVISAGAQETTRILLRNKNIFETVSPSLGKFYQGHLSGKIASVKFWGDSKDTDYGFQKDGEVYIRRRFQFSSSFLKENNLLNTAIWLDNPLYFDPAHKSGAMSFMYLAMITPIIGKKLAPPAIAHSVTKGIVYKVGSHIWNIIEDFPKSFIIPIKTFYGRYILKRKLPGVFLYSPENIYALHFHSEQIPFEKNQMSLAEDGETLVIDYELTDTDINSVIKLHEKLDDWLRKSNCGELVYWFDKSEMVEAIRNVSKDGIHQSGTTRIGHNIDEGVVNDNLETFGINNLYICSSSVFPTSGQANPTFFLGAFAVRLAEFLTKK